MRGMQRVWDGMSSHRVKNFTIYLEEARWSLLFAHMSFSTTCLFDDIFSCLLVHIGPISSSPWCSAPGRDVCRLDVWLHCPLQEMPSSVLVQGFEETCMNHTSGDVTFTDFQLKIMSNPHHPLHNGTWWPFWGHWWSWSSGFSGIKSHQSLSIIGRNWTTLS